MNSLQPRRPPHLCSVGGADTQHRIDRPMERGPPRGSVPRPHPVASLNDWQGRSMPIRSVALPHSLKQISGTHPNERRLSQGTTKTMLNDRRRSLDTLPLKIGQSRHAHESSSGGGGGHTARVVARLPFGFREPEPPRCCHHDPHSAFLYIRDDSVKLRLTRQIQHTTSERDAIRTVLRTHPSPSVSLRVGSYSKLPPLYLLMRW